jgi:hypothetical protein
VRSMDEVKSDVLQLSHRPAPSFRSFITVALSLSRTFASLTGPCRGWKAFTAHNDRTEEAVLCTDPMTIMRQLDLKVSTATST